MIKSFRHKGLRELFEKGSSGKIRHDLKARALRRLDVLTQAEALEELHIPGFDFHRLRGKPVRYSIHVNGNFCITFSWEKGNAIDVDLVDHH